VCVLQLCGEYDAKEIAAAVTYLEDVGDDCVSLRSDA
jgi:hypothetical protein